MFGSAPLQGIPEVPRSSIGDDRNKYPYVPTVWNTCRFGFVKDIQELFDKFPQKFSASKNTEGFNLFHLAVIGEGDRGGIANLPALRLLAQPKYGQNINDVNLSGCNALHIAIKHHADSEKTVELLETLLELGVDPEQPDREGKTPLVRAAEKSMKLATEILLRKNNPTSSSKASLIQSVFSRDDIDPKILEILLQKFIPQGLTQSFLLPNGDFLIHAVVRRGFSEFIPLLYRLGVDINNRNKEGLSALHLACQEGHLPVVKALLSCFADTETPAPDGMTALFYAYHYAKRENFDFLQEAIALFKAYHANLWAEGPQRKTLGALVAKEEDKKWADLLETYALKPASSSKSKKRGLLRRASSHKAEEQEEMPRPYEFSDPHCEGYKEFFRAVKQKQREKVQAFLQGGANPRVRNESGQTLLHMAYEAACKDYEANKQESLAFEFFRWLLEGQSFSIDVNLVDNKVGETLLHKACKLGLKLPVESLLKANALTVMRDSEGFTPLHRVFQLKDGQARNTLLRLLVQYGAAFDLPDQHGNGCLLQPGVLRESELTEFLLDKGADPDLVNKSGRTALLQVLLDTELGEKEKEARAKLLCTKGKADVNLISGSTTPLIVSLQVGLRDFIRWLLAHGANPDLAPPEGLSPTSLAKQNSEIHALLTEPREVNDLHSLLTPAAPATSSPRGDSEAIPIEQRVDRRRSNSILEINSPLSSTSSSSPTRVMVHRLDFSSIDPERTPSPQSRPRSFSFLASMPRTVSDPTGGISRPNLRFSPSTSPQPLKLSALDLRSRENRLREG